VLLFYSINYVCSAVPIGRPRFQRAWNNKNQLSGWCHSVYKGLFVLGPLLLYMFTSSDFEYHMYTYRSVDKTSKMFWLQPTEIHVSMQAFSVSWDKRTIMGWQIYGRRDSARGHAGHQVQFWHPLLLAPSPPPRPDANPRSPDVVSMLYRVPCVSGLIIDYPYAFSIWLSDSRKLIEVELCVMPSCLLSSRLQE